MSKANTKKPSRNNSSLIHMFVEQKQIMEIKDEATTNLETIGADIKKRRDIRQEKFPDKKKAKSSKAIIEENLKRAEKFKSMEEHKMELPALYQKLKTDPEQGLGKDFASDLNHTLGDNILTEKKKTPWYVKLIKEFVSVFALMLWFGSILCFIAYGLAPTDPSNLYLAVVLCVVVIISGTSTFLQNYKSESIMDNFKNFIPPRSSVLRGGEWIVMAASKLVPGDIISLKGGDRVPADFRIITCTEMRVDNSSLTGESEPLLRSVECTHPNNPLETKNLCFFGTLCKEGNCKGIVIAIGDTTVIGQIANLASNAGGEETPLHKEMDHFIIIIAVIATTMGVIFFAIGFPIGYKFLTNLLFAIGIITGNCPEGLLITITVSLTLCAKSLATKSVLAKNLESVETLGSTTTICSDKTGTLTQNRMTIENIWYDGKILKAINKEKFHREPEKFPGIKLEYDENSVGFRTLHEVAVVSSEAEFISSIPPERTAKLDDIKDKALQTKTRAKLEEEWKKELATKLILEKPVNGDASETAIVRFFHAIQPIEETRKRISLVKVDSTDCRVAFNSTNKFAFSIVENEIRLPDGSTSYYSIYIKGAPERIWKLSNKVSREGNEEHLDATWTKKFEDANELFGRRGERVLGFAKCHLSGEKFPKNYQFNSAVSAKPPTYIEWNFPITGMTFVGLVSLIDPPRDAVPFSIKKCKTAGIKVIMVTGDQPITAEAIARKVNIFSDNSVSNIDLMEQDKSLSTNDAIMRADSIVIHGDLITEASKEDETLQESERGKRLSYWLSKKEIVFARTSPAQKLIIVKGCQARNEVVAVTGDGVNDSPAIKKADIGIAMGIAGSDIAKDAADLILLTDDFSALVLGVEEGRKLFDNLKKSICYTITSNIPEIIPFLLLIILQIPLAVTTVLLLCIDLGTDMFPAISFAYENAELDIMVRRPRDRHEHLVTRKLIVFSYLEIGVFQTFGAYITFFIVFNDFGIPMSQLIGLALKPGVHHQAGDVYDPYSPYMGNSNLIGACDAVNQIDNTSGRSSPVDWIFSEDIYQDLRMLYPVCERDANTNLITGNVLSSINFGTCNEHTISGMTRRPFCYSIEACKAAQTAYLFSIVVTQYANMMVNKTRRTSIYFHGLTNFYSFWALAIETIFCICLSYIPPLNLGLGTREVTFLHFGVPACIFTLILVWYDEIRKSICFKISMKGVKENGKPGWWIRNYMW
jgi:sodium/potassium-transporting ATPase subunit alpha